MEGKTMNEVDDTANNPLLEFSIKLCAAVKKEKCLHDRTSVRKYTTPDIEAAWDRVAKECNETIEYCKYRWKSMYKSFFRNYKRCNHYYLHDHMLFLNENDQQKAIIDDTNTIDKFNDDISHQESEMDGTQLEEERGSDSDSQTASADEISISATAKEKRKFSMFLNEENETDAEEDEPFGKRKRSNHKRACKRGLDPKLLKELAEEDSEEKRPRRSLEKTKSLTQLKEKVPIFKVDSRHIKVKHNNKTSYAEMDEMKREDLKVLDTCESLKMVDSFTNTNIQYCHASTQYEISDDSLNQLDDMFINTLRTQLSKMNGRQKLNFKSKIYHSLMDVFDDATDFPNAKEVIKAPPQGAPLLVNTTTGELRLMRELVSLVQAAKSTPEIIKAKDKVIHSTLNKTPVKEKTTAGNQAAEGGLSNQISHTSSPSFEDDDIDFNLYAENFEGEEDAHLPRSLDEIMVNPNDNREPNKSNNVMGLPRHVLQKVVKVAGSNGSTIVARDGDKRRIYRIYPKGVNQLDGRLVVNKSSNSVGTFYVAPPKSGVPTNNSTLNKTSNNSASISVKNFAHKSSNVSNAYSTSVGNNHNQSVYNSTTKRIDSPSLYKSIHPANRILNASTGLFQESSSASTPSPPPNMGSSGCRTTQASSQSSTQSTGGRPGSTFTTTPKLVPIHNSMLPPNSNAASGYPSRKPMQVRSSQQSPQILQRRFSICGPLPPEKTNSSPNSMQATSRVDQSSNSSISQIQISKPISLNKQANNATVNKITKSNTKEQLQELTSEQKPTTTKNKDTNNFKPTEAVSSKVQEELPIIETAGTITADSLDPLYVKQTPIKSEPIDD